MANAVVAVFDEYDEAQSTVNDLLVAGFDKNEVRLSAEEESAEANIKEDREPKSGLKAFFNRLFGTDDRDDLRVYDEAVRHGNYVVTAIAATDEKSELASEVMSHHHPVDLDERRSEWLGSEAQESGGISAGQPLAKSNDLDESRWIPVLEEEVTVGKREAQRGGVRIFQRVSEVPIDEKITLREEQIGVERVPFDKPVTQRTEKIGEERTEGGNDQYRQHWQQNYGSQGGSYEDYSPGYQYGSTAASSTLYQGRDWNAVEPELRSDWEGRYPGSTWERFKESIRHAFGGGRKNS